MKSRMKTNDIFFFLIAGGPHSKVGMSFQFVNLYLYFYKFLPPPNQYPPVTNRRSLGTCSSCFVDCSDSVELTNVNETKTAQLILLWKSNAPKQMATGSTEDCLRNVAI